MESALYEGTISHLRLEPFRHAFRRRLFLVYLDLAELDTVFAGRWLWGVERRTVASFRRRDHLGDPARPLDQEIRERVAGVTGYAPRGPIRLLTHLRYCGYVFNPISLYYCFAGDGCTLEAVVAEVTNTPWGERHAYVLPACSAERRGRWLDFRTAKELHVSPFLGMDVEHAWRLSVPGDRLTVAIRNLRAGRRRFAATLSLTRREIGTAALARALVRHPLITAQVIAGIHWQALRLWWRGAPFHPHPRTPAAQLLERSP